MKYKTKNDILNQCVFFPPIKWTEVPRDLKSNAWQMVHDRTTRKLTRVHGRESLFLFCTHRAKPNIKSSIIMHYYYFVNWKTHKIKWFLSQPWGTKIRKKSITPFFFKNKNSKQEKSVDFFLKTQPPIFFSSIISIFNVEILRIDPPHLDYHL